MTNEQKTKIEKEFNDKYKETRVIISSTHTSHISDVDEEIRFNKKDILNFIFQTYDELLADKRKEVEIGEKQNLGEDEAWCYWYKCPKCGDTMITKNKKFCGECGSQLKWTE